MSKTLQDEKQATPEVNALEVDGDETVGPSGISPEDDARIRRKIDFNLLPLLCIIYGLQFLDKTCMSYASVMGFRTDTNLSLDQYSWLGSIFYFGYLVGEFPLTFALQKFPISKVTSTVIIIWGTILALMSVGGNFQGLLVLRFFLGIAESCMTPALGLFMTQYYKVREQGTRTGIWFSFNGIGNVLGALLGYGLYTGDRAGSLPIAGCKLVYIILGALTVFVGIMFLIFIPDVPEKARWLSKPDRKLAVERIRANQQGVINKSFRVDQAKEAFKDPFTWIYAAVALLACIPNGGITNFFAILIQGFGFTSSQSLLLGMTQATIGISYVLFLWLGDKLQHRCLVSLIPSTISTLGVLLIWLLPDSMKVGRLIGFILSITFIVVYATTISLITSNVIGYTKKTTVNGIFFVAYCIGNLIGPQTFRASDAPRYAPALATVIGCNTLLSCLMVLTHFLYKRENARRDRMITEADLNQVVGHEFDDMTDRQNPAFRYAL